MSVENVPHPTPETSPYPDFVQLLDRNAIRKHLDIISSLDKTALMNTLVPHQELPIYDPASYIISRKEDAPTYSLGKFQGLDVGRFRHS